MTESAGRVPGNAQGWLLVATTWLAVAAAAVIAPVAPRMAMYFAADPGAMPLVQISVGLPSLFVALLAGLFGVLADRIGRRRLLLGAMLLYAACGVAPFWLDNLVAILVSRAGVGVAEAAVLATATALIGDYFAGERREGWFAIQGATATLVATLLIGVSGALSEAGWRLPFAMYLLPAGLALLVARAIWEPARAAPAREAAAPAPRMLAICGVTLLTAICFFVMLVQLPFLLVERGSGAPWQLAAGGVAATITAPLGALLFRLTARRPVAARLAASFAASGTGLLIVVCMPGYLPTLLGAAINGLGSGMALPTLMAWAMAGRAPSVMGRVAGTWNAAYALGQFLSPPLFLAIAGLAGGIAGGMAAFAAVLGVGAIAAAALAARQSRAPDLHVRFRT
jgi:MFS family permease